MKKIVIIICSLLLIGCENLEEKELNTYNNYIKELEKITESSENIPIGININIEKLENNIISFTALVDRKDKKMKDIEAIIIHDCETSDIFPSIGIFDEEISFDDKNEEKGIKLTGYLEDKESITFKFMIKYKSEKEKEEKYYFIYNYRQEN